MKNNEESVQAKIKAKIESQSLKNKEEQHNQDNKKIDLIPKNL